MTALRAKIRNWHRILMLVLGLQFLIWSLSGLYMVVFDIEFIRGNHLTKPQHISLNALASNSTLSFDALTKRYPDANDISLYAVAENLRYKVNVADTTMYIDALSGKELSLLNRQEATDIAQYHFSEFPIAKVDLINEDAPSELSSRHLPVWQITYKHWSAPTLYISQKSGLLVTKRHWYWRVFDLFWIMHIIDYQDIGDITKNMVFKVIAAFSIFASLTGCYLLISRFRVRKVLRVKALKGRD